MYDISVYKAISKEAVELVIALDDRRMKEQVILYLLVAEGCNRNETSENYDRGGNSQHPV